MIENFKLHVFRVVADALNFSKAAEELHISQPAVTSQVRTLEEGLGIPLENGPIKRPLSFALLSGPVREGPLQDLIGLLRAVSPRTMKRSVKGDKAAGPAI